MRESILRGELTFQNAEGIETKYLSIADKKKPQFVRDTDKPEAGIVPELEGTIRVVDNEQRSVEPAPFDKAINQYIKADQETSVKKVTFESKELFSQASHLCQQIPHWKTDSDNPIFKYVPESERPFKPTKELTLEEIEQMRRNERYM